MRSLCCPGAQKQSFIQIPFPNFLNIKLIFPRDNNPGQQWEYFCFCLRNSADGRRMEMLDRKDATVCSMVGMLKNTDLQEKTMEGCYHDVFWTVVGAEATEHWKRHRFQRVRQLLQQVPKHNPPPCKFIWLWVNKADQIKLHVYMFPTL